MNIESTWNEAIARQGNPAPLTGKELQAIISSRVRKEFKTVSGYIWAMIVYQIILYSFLSHTLVRNWGNMEVMLLCLAGAALYIPVTVALIRHTRMLYGPFQDSDTVVPNLRNNVASHHKRLADFFRFKKRMDWIGVPVSCAIVVLVTFTLFIPGSIGEHPLSALLMYALWIGMSLVAIRSENKTRFVEPLRQLETVLKELNEPIQA